MEVQICGASAPLAPLVDPAVMYVGRAG